MYAFFLKIICKVPLIVLCATTLHVGWAINLAIDDHAWGATPLSALIWFGRIGAIVTLVSVGGLAIWSSWIYDSWWRLALLWPQQGLLFMSSGAAIQSMWSGHYADGVARPHAFVVSDQLPTCLIAVMHLVAVFREIGG